MKKIAYLIVAAALVALGWFLGRRSSDDQSKVAYEVLTAHTYNSAYTELTICETVIEQLDSGRIDDAKEMLRGHQDGCIFSLENALDPMPMSSEDLIAVRDLNVRLQSSHGSKRDVADRVLARVARHRADHPWTYKGDLPHSTDPEVEAKLESILKRASENQK